MMPGIDGIATLDELKRNRRRPCGHHHHGVCVGRKRHLRDEERRVRLHHQAVKNDECSSWCGTPWSAGVSFTRTGRCARTSRELYHKSRTSSGAVRGCAQVFDLIIQAAPSRSTILIQGESGTGKELRGAGEFTPIRRARIDRS